ncbi:hypothetical protein ADUPG1_010796, partial [Aduncisulcus paluster]
MEHMGKIVTFGYSSFSCDISLIEAEAMTELDLGGACVIDDMSGLEFFTALQSLALGSYVGAYDFLDYHVDSLISLTISDFDSEQDMSYISHLYALERIGFSLSPITVDILRDNGIFDLQSLGYIYFQQTNQITSLSFLYDIPNPENVVSLSLFSCSQLTDLTALEVLTDLQLLFISGDNFGGTEFADSELDKLTPILPSISSLSLTGIPFSNLDFIANAAECNLTNIVLADTSIESVSSLSLCPYIQNIYISSNDSLDLGTYDICSNENLVNIELHHPSAGQTTASDYQCMNEFADLETICFSNILIGDDNFQKWFVPLSSSSAQIFPSLRSLDISHSDVESLSGFGSLPESSPASLPLFESIIIFFTPLSDISAIISADLPSLRIVNFQQDFICSDYSNDEFAALFAQSLTQDNFQAIISGQMCDCGSFDFFTPAFCLELDITDPDTSVELFTVGCDVGYVKVYDSFDNWWDHDSTFTCVFDVDGVSCLSSDSETTSSDVLNGVMNSYSYVPFRDSAGGCPAQMECLSVSDDPTYSVPSCVCLEGWFGDNCDCECPVVPGTVSEMCSIDG